MKNLYPKNKGKVHPSPSSLSPTKPAQPLSILQLLPAAILALASILSIEDREVLAYLVTRSLNPSSIVQDKKKCKKTKPPLFHCGCFDCYTIYWVRWDSSPNRELIHQAIEAFEDHLTNGERSKRATPRAARARKRVDKMDKRENGVSVQVTLHEPEVEVEATSPAPVTETEVGVLDLSDFEEVDKVDLPGNLTWSVEAVHVPVTKGMARKFLPDVLGLFNSRIWSLWSPNI